MNQSVFLHILPLTSLLFTSCQIASNATRPGDDSGVGNRSALEGTDEVTLNPETRQLVFDPNSLSSAVYEMLLHEPELQAAAHETGASIDDARRVKGEMLPQIGMYASTGWDRRQRDVDGLVEDAGSLFSRQVGLNIEQLLFDFGAAKNRTVSAKHLTEVEYYNELDQAEARVVDLVEVCLEILRTREQIAESERNIADHAEIMSKLKQKADSGYSDADLALVEGRLNLAETSLQTQFLALERAEDRFVRLVGRSPGALKLPNTPTVPRQLASLSTDQVWSMRAADKAVDAAVAAAQASAREQLPKVYANAGGYLGEDLSGIPGDDYELNAGLRMSWNLWDGGSQRATAKRDHKLICRAKELRRAAEKEFNYNGTLAIKELLGTEATLASLESYENRLAKVQGDYTKQFNVGKRELLGILDVKNERHTAKTRLIDSQYNRRSLSYRILGLQGQLIEHLLGDAYTSSDLREVLHIRGCEHPSGTVCSKGGPVGNKVVIQAQKK